MIKLNTLLSVIVIFFCSQIKINGQDSINRSFTVYFNGYLEIDKLNFYDMNTSNSIGLFPSFAYQVDRRFLSYQFELMPIMFRTIDYIDLDSQNSYITGGEKKKILNSYGKINLYFKLFSGETNKLEFSFGNRIFYNYEDYHYYESSKFGKSVQRIGLSSDVGLCYTKQIGKSFAICFVPEYIFNEFYCKSNYSNNPQLPVIHRRVSDFNDDFMFARFNFKIGLKMRIE